MKDILYIYKIMLRHYGYLLAGLFFLIGYALFSGASITMAVPFFDYVFPQVEVEAIYFTGEEFWNAIRQVTLDQSRLLGPGALFNINNLRPLFSEYGSVMEKTDSMLMLKMVAIFLFTIIFIKNLFFFLKRLMFANLNGKTIQDIRNKIFEKYMSQSLRFFSQYRLGDSLVRIVQDVDIVSRLFIMSLFNVIRDIMLLLVYMRIALFLNSRLFLISLIVLPITTLMVTAVGRKIKKYAKRIQWKFADIFSKVEEVLNNIKIVKAYGREDSQVQSVKSLNRKFFLFWRKSEVYKAFGVPISELSGTIIGIVILLIGGRQVVSGVADFSFGEFGAFLLALFSMLHPIKNITKAYNELKKAMVSLDRISEIINCEPDLPEVKNAVEKKSFEDKIVFDNVSFSYNVSTSSKAPERDREEEEFCADRLLSGSEPDIIHKRITDSGAGRVKKTLSDISFTISKGEKVALVGSSGSGKTTITNLLLRLYDIGSGDITMDGVSIAKLKIKDLRNLFGIVTQESLLFSETISDNIRFGSSKKLSDDEIKTACKIAHADEFIEQLPDKYEQILHAKGSNLSGGQKQRLCIARAVAGNPPILILDEATSSLDSEAEQKVQLAIEQATKKRTVLIIAHRLSTVLAADKIIVIDEGKIVGMGTHQELLNNCPKYKLLYELQFNSPA